MIRIGIEAQRLFRPNKHGMEIVALELIRQLQLQDQQNLYSVFARTGKDRNCITPSARMGIKVAAAASYVTWEQRQLRSLIRKEKPDVLHCTANTGPIGSSVPLVLTLHDVIFLEEISFQGSPYQNFGNLYRRAVVSAIAKQAATICTVSHYEKQKIIDRLGIPAERVEVVYNGVSERFHRQYLKSEITAARLKHGLPEQFILFLGNTAPKKNTRNVLKAYAGYRRSCPTPLPLVIADLEASLLARYLSELQIEAISPFVITTGYIPTQEMPLIYAASSLFLYPSLRESFGLPVLEAMASGVPVLASNTSAIPEVAGEAAYLADPLDPLSMTAGMVEILSNQDLHRQMTNKGREHARLFTWEAAATKMIRIYEQTAAKA
jgi:glycosyltransferase involved in cell wall biosynthesis